MAASGASVLADEIVDTDRLPIAQPGPDRDAWIAGLRAAMDQDGCAVVPRFVRPGRIAELVAECDRVNHTVTLAIQNSDRGGRFEYCPRLRTSSDENYQGVAAVLDGAADHLVRSLDLRPGDLQIFAGRHSLHRVTPVAGPTPRYVGIFSFVEEPGMVGSPERTRQLYGRVLPIHLERAGRRADALVD